MKHIENNGGIAAKFMKVADTVNGVIVGLLGKLSSSSIRKEDIEKIAFFYNINGYFDYRFITPEEAMNKGCRFPAGNYNSFLEISKIKEKEVYYKQTIIPELRKNGVTLDRISKELDYRSMSGVSESETHCGWDDDLYLYSADELSDVEELWEKVS